MQRELEESRKELGDEQEVFVTDGMGVSVVNFDHVHRFCFVVS